jgi:hypothetical protein
MTSVSPLHQIFAVIGNYSKTMGSLHGDSLRIVKRDIERFKETTGDIHDQMLWQGLSVVLLSTTGAGLSVAASLTTEQDKLMKSNFETGAKFCHDIMPAPEAWFRSQITGLEANKELTRICFQEGKENKSTFINEVRRANEAALSILQSKTRGG